MARSETLKRTKHIRKRERERERERERIYPVIGFFKFVTN